MIFTTQIFRDPKASQRVIIADIDTILVGRFGGSVKIRLDKAGMEKTETELRANFSEAQKSLEEKSNQVQVLQTELAVAEEKLNQQVREGLAIKNQYESRLQRTHAEKDSVVEDNNKLNAEVARLNNHIAEQAQKHQKILDDERARQETSENRWLELIDKARTETNEQRKRLDNMTAQLNEQIKELQTQLADHHQKRVTNQSTLEQKNIRIAELLEQHNKTQEKYHQATTTIAILQERLDNTKNKSSDSKAKKQLNRVE